SWRDQFEQALKIAFLRDLDLPDDGRDIGLKQPIVKVLSAVKELQQPVTGFKANFLRGPTTLRTIHGNQSHPDPADPSIGLPSHQPTLRAETRSVIFQGLCRPRRGPVYFRPKGAASARPNNEET